MAKSKPFKYTGKLVRPIPGKRIGFFANEDVYSAEAERTTQEMLSKLPDLFQAHGVEEGNWVGLSIALAKAHVPGFKVVKPAGRKTEWGPSDKAEFRLDVDTIIEKSGLTVVEAIKQAIRLDDWSEKAAAMSKGTIGAFEKHYYDADLRWVEIAKKARAFRQLPPSVQARAEREFYESITPAPIE